MINPAFHTSEVQNWLKENLQSDPRQLAFKGSPFSDVSTQELLNQLQLRQNIRSKLPTWYDTDGIIYPTKVNIEQTSSEVTSAYKASLVQGEKLIDITGGFGVDAYHFAKRVKNVIHVERNTELQQIAAKNFEILQVGNIQSFNEDGVEFIENYSEEVDVIFADPSRRDGSNARVILLHDMQPDLLKIQDMLLEKAHTVMLKLAPMLDIQYITERLKNIFQIHIVAVQNEVKEILVLQKRFYAGSPKIILANLQSEWENIHIQPIFGIEHPIAEPKKYLYLPGNALMKILRITDMHAIWGLHALHRDTSIFTSDALIEHFPGEVFSNIREINLKKGNFRGTSWRIIHRNFPVKIPEIKRKFGLKDDGTQALIFTQTQSGSHIWEADKIK
ncbi:MAG: RsmD family RNA methyltransferase [Weeksellaceae bacterium]|nr:RsmD family RNA methyltransferase [Weeksellaceae bacterium]